MPNQRGTSSGPDPANFEHVDVWVFDLDNTLYSPRRGIFDQVDRKMTEYVSKRFGLGHDDARALQKALFRSHGSTMRGLMTEHGVDPDHFLDYVHDVDIEILPPNEDLAAALARLAGRKLVFTSASLPYALRIMERIGIEEHFEAVYDIVAAEYLPKPHAPTYRRFLAVHEVDAARAAMFEDIAKNLRPAAELGMTTIWVPGLSDWGREDSDGDHIHYVADDLTEWLTALTAERAG